MVLANGGVSPTVFSDGWASASSGFLLWVMSLFEDCGFSIQARLQALKDELQHLVLSISEDSGVQSGDSFASMVPSDKAK